MAIRKRITEGHLYFGKGKPKYIRLDCSRGFLRLLQTVPRIGTVMARSTLLQDWVHPIELKKFEIEGHSIHVKLAYHYDRDMYNRLSGDLKVAAILVLVDVGISYNPLIRVNVSNYYLRKKFVKTSMKKIKADCQCLYVK